MDRQADTAGLVLTASYQAPVGMKEDKPGVTTRLQRSADLLRQQHSGAVTSRPRRELVSCTSINRLTRCIPALCGVAFPGGGARRPLLPKQGPCTPPANAKQPRAAACSKAADCSLLGGWVLPYLESPTDLNDRRVGGKLESCWTPPALACSAQIVHLY